MITSRGCDRSVLLNSTASNQAEREAYVNFGLRGVAEIDEIKAALEYACPGVVSSADILIKAARDATVKKRSGEGDDEDSGFSGYGGFSYGGGKANASDDDDEVRSFSRLQLAPRSERFSSWASVMVVVKPMPRMMMMKSAASPDYNSRREAKRFSSWASPGSLAPTRGIHVSFFSSALEVLGQSIMLASSGGRTSPYDSHGVDGRGHML
ncbi:hypothetical protein AXG93_2956s1090 [Marchantia polymorpha subsp. ruderalis]|uniref:Plant heme peroxidase family profile domain-containing protein n=1 Tax=Marchantia polymorpha subsp. ruderalis TaxID=1480154 RepID=A0A176WAQ6_MARPO|nr:hypothetical protein AXG93_2956s1090 [Marchantia polymorpha subsp. ruderalis]